MWALGAFELRWGDEASAAPEDAEHLVELVYRARTRSSLSVDRLKVGEASHRFLGADDQSRSDQSIGANAPAAPSSTGSISS